MKLELTGLADKSKIYFNSDFIAVEARHYSIFSVTAVLTVATLATPSWSAYLHCFPLPRVLTSCPVHRDLWKSDFPSLYPSQQFINGLALGYLYPPKFSLLATLTILPFSLILKLAHFFHALGLCLAVVTTSNTLVQSCYLIVSLNTSSVKSALCYLK